MIYCNYMSVVCDSGVPVSWNRQWL